LRAGTICSLWSRVCRPNSRVLGEFAGNWRIVPTPEKERWRVKLAATKAFWPSLFVEASLAHHSVLPLDILHVWIYILESETGFLLKLIVGGRLIS
jgi:hypothetical protein